MYIYQEEQEELIIQHQGIKIQPKGCYNLLLLNGVCKQKLILPICPVSSGKESIFFQQLVQCCARELAGHPAAGGQQLHCAPLASHYHHRHHIIISIITFPSFSVLLNRLYLNPQILPFFFHSLPHPTARRGGSEWLCGLWLPAWLNHTTPVFKAVVKDHEATNLPHIFVNPALVSAVFRSDWRKGCFLLEGLQLVLKQDELNFMLREVFV